MLWLNPEQQSKIFFALLKAACYFNTSFPFASNAFLNGIKSMLPGMNG